MESLKTTDHQEKIQPPLPVSLSPSPSGPAHSFLDTPQPGELPAVHKLIRQPLCTSCSLSLELPSLPSPLGLKTQLSATPLKPPRSSQAESDAPSCGFHSIFFLISYALQRFVSPSHVTAGMAEYHLGAKSGTPVFFQMANHKGKILYFLIFEKKSKEEYFTSEN